MVTRYENVVPLRTSMQTALLDYSVGIVHRPLQNSELENLDVTGCDRATNQPREERVHYGYRNIAIVRQRHQHLKRYVERVLSVGFEKYYFQDLLRKIERHMTYLRNLDGTEIDIQNLLKDAESLRLKVRVTLKSIIHKGGFKKYTVCPDLGGTF